MIAIFQSFAILLDVTCIAYQLVGIARGEAKNRMVLWAFVIALFGLVLSILAVQDWLDRILTPGYANLILRFDLYLLFAILGHILLTSFGVERLARYAFGFPGGIVLGVFMGLTLASFYLGGNPVREPSGLAIIIYSLAWRAHMAYVGIICLSALLPAIFDHNRHPITRTSAGIFGFSFLIVVAMFFVAAAQFALGPLVGDLLALMIYSAAILCALGVILAWSGHKRARVAA